MPKDEERRSGRNGTAEDRCCPAYQSQSLALDSRPDLPS